MQTLTLASIYELQGLKDEALDIYKDILKSDPQDSEAKVAIRRLSGIRKHFSGVDKDMKAFFVRMDSDIEYLEFERWLIQI